jgi:hypothetical protein
LAHVDRVTGEPVRRYEHPHPGELLHVDVKKLGNIPDGSGWRYVGRAQGLRRRAATPDKPRNRYRNPQMGSAFVHTVLDDHSRIAYAEIHDDERAETATATLRRAVGWFAERGVTVARVLSDNGSAYRSQLWRETCAELGITPTRRGGSCRQLHGWLGAIPGRKVANVDLAHGQPIQRRDGPHHVPTCAGLVAAPSPLRSCVSDMTPRPRGLRQARANRGRGSINRRLWARGTRGLRSMISGPASWAGSGYADQLTRYRAGCTSTNVPGQSS